MSASEAIRHRIYERFKESHGEEMAADMLEVLPPAGLPELATKDDVGRLRNELSAEIALLRSELSREIGSVQSDLSAEIGSVQSDLSAEVGSVRADMELMEARLRLEIAERSSQSLRVIVAVVTVATAVLGLLVTLG